MMSPLNYSPYGNHRGENALGGVHHLSRHFSKLGHLLAGQSLWPSLYLLRLSGLKKPCWSLEDQARAEEKGKSLTAKTYTWWANVLRIVVALQTFPFGAFTGQWGPEALPPLEHLSLFAGWGDGSVGRVFAVYVWGSVCIPSIHVRARHSVSTCDSSNGHPENRISWTHGLPSLMRWCHKNQVESDRGSHLRLICGFCMYIHVCDLCIHTYTTHKFK